MSLIVAGGYYKERCLEPKWDGYFGPGGRAAACLSNRGDKITLYSYCEQALVPAIREFCSFYQIDDEIVESRKTPSFFYKNWLSEPRIEVIPGEAPLKVVGENVLRFGFIEGDAIVNARRAVYDPQSPRSLSFWANGSTAEELAVVCNYSQASYMTGEKDPVRIAKILFQKSSVQAIVIKNGWWGLWAFSRGTMEHIAPTLTATVHKIGSGDVFSAEFANAWMINKIEPIQAARMASYRTALYCENGGVVPLPKDRKVRAYTVPKLKAKEQCLFDVSILCASGSSELARLSKEANSILTESGLKTFLNLGDKLDSLLKSRYVLAFIERSDCAMYADMFLALNMGLPAICYRPDGSVSVRLQRNQCEIVEDFGSAIYKAIWWGMS